jgi:ATP-dependent DNA helicase RecG
MGRSAAAKPADDASALTLATPLLGQPGIGAKTAARLAAAGLRTIGDLLWCFPRRCLAVRTLDEPEAECVQQWVRIQATVQSVALQWLPGRRAMVVVRLATAGGARLTLRFFRQTWLKKQLLPGSLRWVEGILQQEGKHWALQQPRLLSTSLPPGGEVQLRYPVLPGIPSLRLQRWIHTALARIRITADELPPLPPLPSLPSLPAGSPDLALDPQQALQAMHQPADLAAHEAARRHFAIREAVQLFAKVAKARQQRQQRKARSFPTDARLRQRILARLPFALSPDQAEAIDALHQRLAGPGAMGVLLQGDVGTGKTAVAIAAALAVLARGGRVAFLAPTALLAGQHHRIVSGWLAGSDVQVQLCTSTEPPPDPAPQQPTLVFGTHALWSGERTNIAWDLVIIDEQHRFGVAQRMALVAQGYNPHVLVMSATPIPRTLALARFGDLDLVQLKHRPGGRRSPPALHLPSERWPRAVRSIARAIRRGGRVLVVCPAVGADGERGGVLRLQQALREFRCAIVHGRQTAAEQRAAIEACQQGSIDVLIGTTVLEVGIDLPQATLCVVVAADRFGIATLHQLRGRVGRGDRRGLALLCGPRTERIAAVCATRDGLQLAERDLALRGSGELLGEQQSGFDELRALDPVTDLELLLAVRAAVSSPPASH